MRTNMKFLPLLSGILIAVIIAGCNIFSFVSDAEKSPVEKAEEAIRDGDYAKAREALADAVKDSTDSMALYMNAKISLLDRGIDFTKIVDLIEGQDDVQSGDNLAILGTIDEMDDAEKTDWYIANMDVRANLAKIFHNKTTGMLKKDDIALDYTVSNMMSGVFGLRDTNRDGIIDANDFQINLSFISNIGGADTEGFNFDGGEFFDEENPDVPVEFSGFEVFLGEYVPPGTGKISAVHKGKSGYTPDMINELIAFVLTLLDDGGEGIKLLLNQADTSFETDEIEEYIDQIAAIINFYWYHDGEDNDGDGRTDEEIINGKDDDKDGLFDEDTKYHPADKINKANKPIKNFVKLFEKWQKKAEKID